MFGMGWQELILIVIVALILFGAKRLPEIGRSVGRAIIAFKEGLKEGEHEGPTSGKSDADKK